MTSAKLQMYLRDMEKHPPTNIDSIKIVENELHIAFPDQYVEFLLFCNGAEGGIGPSNYIDIWKCEDIIPFNISYKVKEYYPGLVFFASDLGGTFFALYYRGSDIAIVEIPACSTLDEIKIVSDSFINFLAYEYENDGTN